MLRGSLTQGVLPYHRRPNPQHVPVLSVPAPQQSHRHSPKTSPLSRDKEEATSKLAVTAGRAGRILAWEKEGLMSGSRWHPLFSVVGQVWGGENQLAVCTSTSTLGSRREEVVCARYWLLLSTTFTPSTPA
jgi:hypothetical protein